MGHLFHGEKSYTKRFNQESEYIDSNVSFMFLALILHDFTCNLMKLDQVLFQLKNS